MFLLVTVLLLSQNVVTAFKFAFNDPGKMRGVSLRMSPIGIPKVEYKAPGTNRSEWEDIHTRLYRERILFVSKALDDEYTNMLISALLCLDNEASEKPITLYINSPGGPMTAGLALYDTIKHLKSKIATINVGFCGATASLLLGAGTTGMRSALIHSRVLLHQPSGTLQGSAEHLKTEAKHLLHIKRMIQDVYQQVTKQTLERIVSDLERDNFMSADDCVKYGLVDRIMMEDIQRNIDRPNTFGTADREVIDSLSQVATIEEIVDRRTYVTGALKVHMVARPRMLSRNKRTYHKTTFE